MNSPNWIETLKIFGDKFEKKGVVLGLGERFPRYAEFWGKYVFPERAKPNSPELRPDLDPRYEEIFNNHYGVFYQLTTAIEQSHYIDHSIVDVADPLYHLATAIDLIHRTFVVARYTKGDLILNKLEESDYREKADKFWSNYPDSFKQFAENKDIAKNFRRPISMPIHSLDNLFNDNTPQNKEFRKVADRIRAYRNTYTHNLPPLKLKRIQEGKVCILKEKALKEKYEPWSSARRKVKDERYQVEFAPAEEIIGKLANDLASSANNIWTVLLDWIKEIIPEGEKRTLQITETMDPLQWLLGVDTAQASGMVYVDEENNPPYSKFSKLIDSHLMESEAYAFYSDKSDGWSKLKEDGEDISTPEDDNLV